jgi:hypothetical protein
MIIINAVYTIGRGYNNEYMIIGFDKTGEGCRILLIGSSLQKIVRNKKSITIDASGRTRFNTSRNALLNLRFIL